MTNFNQYMTKEAQGWASWLPGGAKAGAEGLKGTLEIGQMLLPIVAVAPAIAGSMLAVAHSKLTSPSETETDTVTPQNESLARMYEMEAAKRRREIIEGIKRKSGK